MAETRPEITLPISIPTLNVRAIASEANTFRRLPQSSNSRICCPMSLAPVSSAIQPTEYSTPAHSAARRAFAVFAENNPSGQAGPPRVSSDASRLDARDTHFVAIPLQGGAGQRTAALRLLFPTSDAAGKRGALRHACAELPPQLPLKNPRAQADSTWHPHPEVPYSPPILNSTRNDSSRPERKKRNEER